MEVQDVHDGADHASALQVLPDLEDREDVQSFLPVVGGKLRRIVRDAVVASRYYRAAAAGLVLKYPQVADALAEGKLCLSTVGELGKVITPVNVGEVLPRFFHLSAREAREVVAELAPRPVPPCREVVTVVRPEPVLVSVSAGPRLNTTPPAGAIEATTTSTPGLRPDVRTADFGQASMTVSAPRETCSSAAYDPRKEEQVEPLTANLRRYHVTVTKRWIEKLNAAKAALSHSSPSGSAEEVLEAALDALLEREAKRKGLVKNPRKPRAETEPGGASTPEPSVPTQFDHVQPDSLGGPTTIENGRMVCERHNQLAARKVFGESFMELFPAGASGSRKG